LKKPFAEVRYCYKKNFKAGTFFITNYLEALKCKMLKALMISRASIILANQIRHQIKLATARQEGGGAVLEIHSLIIGLGLLCTLNFV
jgi:hypothetical protein